MYITYTPFLLDTGRLTMLLEQYRDRLHTRGEEDHDDEILYLLQVLESPLMKEFLTEDVPGGGAAFLEEVASVLENHESDVQLSPQSKRKRQLARQASLRALKIALTPRSSPASSPKISKASEQKPQNNFPLIHNLTANRFRKRGGSHKSTPSPTEPLPRDDKMKPHPFINSQQPKNSQFDVPEGTSHSLYDQVVPEETRFSVNRNFVSYSGKRESPPVSMAISTSPTDTNDYSHQHVLSNSTDTLIERTVTPHKKYSTGSEGYSEFVKKGLNSEDIRTPDMADSQEEFLQLLEFSKMSKPTIAAPSLLPAGPPRKDQQPLHLLPMLPSYNEALSSQQRVKSYEDLLSTNPSQPIRLEPTIKPLNNHPTPIAAPPTYKEVSTSGLPQQSAPLKPQTGGITSHQTGGQLITLSLVKGPQGLGFRINKKKNSKKGELSAYVQDVQAGSIADSEGIRKGDFLVSINKQNVSGIGVHTIVSLLQQAKGKVEVVLFRKEGGVAHDGSPSPTLIPPTVVPHQPQNNPSKLNKVKHVRYMTYTVHLHVYIILNNSMYTCKFTNVFSLAWMSFTLDN